TLSKGGNFDSAAFAAAAPAVPPVAPSAGAETSPAEASAVVSGFDSFFFSSARAAEPVTNTQHANSQTGTRRIGTGVTSQEGIIEGGTRRWESADWADEAGNREPPEYSLCARTCRKLLAGR